MEPGRTPFDLRRAVSPLLLPGLLWGVTLFVVLGFVSVPAPASAGEWVTLAAVSAAVAVVHVGAWQAAAGLTVRRRAGWNVVLAAAGGVLYGALSLSLAKFAVARSHLRLDDLRFLAGSARQVGDEATGAERVWLVSILVLPAAFALLLFAALRADRRREPRPTPRRAVATLAAGLVGLGLLAAVSPAARGLVTRALPGPQALLSPSAAGNAPPDGIDEEAFGGTPIGAGWAPPADGRRWNVLVVMLESVPWKRALGPEARPDSTPTLRALAAESIVFTRAYATSTHSDYAQTSILASLHPRKGPAHDFFRELPYPRTLFWDPLAAHGWRTAVFSCQNERWGNMLAFLSTPGLQTLRHAPDWPEAQHRGEGAESKVFEETPTSAFLEWLDAEPGRPFAAYLNFQATHFPYEVPPDWPTPHSRTELDFPATFLSYPRDRIGAMLDRFHDALAYADSQLARVVEGLRTRGLLESTALLVVADHGEAFYEHGLPTHGTTLLEEQVRTTMLLRLPGDRAREITEPVSVLDAIPTIWRAAGWPRHGNFQGRDDVLVPGYRGRDRPLAMTIQGMTHEDGLVLGGWKYIVNWDRRERALFDLGADPEERSNLVAGLPGEAARLDRELARRLGAQLGYYGRRGWESGRYPPPSP